MASLLIHGGLVVPSADAKPLPNADILVRDGRIAAVGRLPGAAGRVDRVLDASGRIVFPGLVKVTKCPAKPGNAGNEESENMQTVVRRAQVICECALASASAVSNGV